MPFFHRLPLVVDVERQRTRHALASHQFTATGDDKAETRYALDTFVRTADEEIDAEFLHIQRHAAETAHRIHNQFLAMRLDHTGQFRQRVQDTRSRLAVYESHVGHIAVARQVLLHHFGVYLHGFLESHHVVGNAVAVGNDSHAVAVGTVAEDKQFVTLLEGTAQHGFHTIGTATLHQHGSVLFRMFRGHLHQRFADFFHDSHIIIFIPSAPVTQHGFFYGF